MYHTKMKIATLVAGLLILGVLLAACGPAATPVATQEVEDQAPAETTAPEPEEPIEVRVGMTPFFDYQFFSVAEEFGWDEELGLNLQFEWLTQSGPSIQALANGSLDTVNTCVVCNFPFYESVPDMQNFLTVNQFKGFVVIGLQGESKSYEEFLAELGDAEAAQKATIEQFHDQTFPIYLANYQPLLAAVLEQAGMTLDDVNTVNFPDDEKAALAMIGGEGTFYMGGLPSEINLLMNHPDQFKLIGGAEILGPAGLWYSNVASSEQWLAENEEVALKIMAMSYRYNRYVQEKPEAVMPIVVEAMNAHSGVATDPEELDFIFDTFLDFRTYQQDQETTYSPESELYWENSAQYYVERSEELPEDADYLVQNPLNAWFDKFLEQSDLLAWVDAPLE